MKPNAKVNANVDSNNKTVERDKRFFFFYYLFTHIIREPVEINSQFFCNQIFNNNSGLMIIQFNII